MAYTVKEEDIEAIAVGCLYILMGKGSVSFPGSDRAHPANRVTISRGTGSILRDGDGGIFPFSVPWDIWQSSVVPVLRDQAVQVKTGNGGRNFLNQRLVWLGEWDSLLDQIRAALRRKLEANGYIPTDEDDEPVITGPEDGEPIVRRTAVGDPDYPMQDTGNLIWPEGHPKLTYPVVD